MGTSRSDQPFVVLPLSSHDDLDQFRSETDVIYETTPQQPGEEASQTRTTALTSAAIGFAATLAVILFTSTLVTSTQPTHRIDATTVAEHSVQGAIVPDARVAATVPAPKLEAAPVAKKSTVPIKRKLPKVEPSRNMAAQPSDLPTAIVEKPVAVAIDAEVTAIASHENRENLTYRWSAPVGTFADAAAGQTKFVCPETPQLVGLTVAVTDANGVTVTDTVMVQCVAAER